MFPDVHLGKRTHIPDSGDVDREVAQEVHNLHGLGTEVEIQDKGGYKRAQQLINNKHLWKINEEHHLEWVGVFVTMVNWSTCVNSL